MSVLWLREGETKVIPGTNGEYYLKNNQFIVEVYDKEKDEEIFDDAIDRVGMIVKNYQSNVTFIKSRGIPFQVKVRNLKKSKMIKYV